ncbi:fibronectin type III domain-containing protein [Flavivirga aquimarina]|uniref:Fibronectin type III domain-containing protein n=1 Tax=Flavivirga aquimarina TaxID=2027862 RepID=A0ABT8W9H6_9FLAO|nr:fibronectin type III domain-containing protein [Flavivirga aquimarina]MDO5969786.1 fibronectin type III domain-containing protein [Flavivirga aquimarina]
MKLIVKLIILFICSISFAQNDSDYQAILDEATLLGYTLPSLADQTIQNQIIISIKASGVWAKADLILYFKGSGDKNFKLINWKNPIGVKATEESFGGSLTWASTGVKGDGIDVINTHFDPSVGGLNYTQNNAGFYAKISEAFTTKFNLFGGANISLSTELQRPEINSDGSLPPVFTFPGTGLLGVSRNNATSHIVSVGTVLTTQTHASGSITSEDIRILGHSTVTSSNYTRFDGEVAYVLFGGDMSANLSDIDAAFEISSFDTQPPTAPTLSSTFQTSTTVDLSWTAATDNIAVTGYKIYKDGVLEATLGNILTYQVTGLTAATSYDFTVTALDIAGNESVVSNTMTITTDVISSGGGSGNWSLNNEDVYYNTGNVGIGTNTPDEKLAVNGNIHAKEVRVDLNNWPDYVFTKTYNLPTLKEVEEHIKEKGHLPNIPSAKEVEAKGILLGDMNAKLLEKIEELTLYILEQEKQLNQLKIIIKQHN